MTQRPPPVRDLAFLGDKPMLMRLFARFFDLQGDRVRAPVGDDRGREQTSADYLDALLRREAALPRSLARNPFDTSSPDVQALASALIGEVVLALGEIVDRTGIDPGAVAPPDEFYALKISGYWHYPPGGYIGWHTNDETPGYRLYVSRAARPGASFFRYRDPDTGEVHTDVDTTWNFRLFEVDPRRSLWHCVYSDTDRYSLGFRINFHCMDVAAWR